MSAHDELLGGRLALADPDTLNTAQRELFDHIFGEAGVFDITVLAGIYHTVCAILNAFAVPAPRLPR